MVARLAMGKFQEGTGLRITKPGFDATNSSSPFILSSDFDYLKVHHQGTIRLNSRLSDGSTSYWNKIYFPALGYIPLVFYSSQITHSQAESRIVYPADRNSSGIEGTWVNVTYCRCLVHDGSLWFEASGPNVEFRVDVRFIIFKQRMIV